MGSHLLVDSKNYLISVKVFTGQGDGTLIYIDAAGHIHVVGPEPGIMREQITEAIKQIELGVDQFAAATAGIKAA
jgi:hypothetical protein